MALASIATASAGEEEAPNSGWWWKSPDSGFEIEARTPEGVVQQAGQSARIEGEIHWRNAHNSGRQPIPKGIQKQVEIRAYFPDLVHEVTDQVNFEDKRLKYRFDTSALSANSPNVFTLIIGRTSAKTSALKSVQGKLERRQRLLAELEAKLKQQKAHPAALDAIQKLQARITAITARIDLQVAERFETLSELRFPLQVGNGVAAPGYHFSLIGGFGFALTWDRGVVIQGEQAKINARITNYRGKLPVAEKDFSQKSAPDSQWVFRFNWLGSQVRELGPQALAPGASVAVDYETDRLAASSSSDLPSFQAQVLKPDEKDGSLKRFGSVALELPVGADAHAPVWDVDSLSPAPGPSFVRALSPVFARVSDSLGRIDLGQVRVKLQGSPVNGTSLEQDVTLRLIAAVLGLSGERLELSGDLNPLEEGSYTLSFEAKDLAGNQATPYPLSRSFQIDRTAPAILLGVQDGYLTNQASWSIPVQIQDRSPTQTRVLQNGLEIYSSTDAVFTVPVTLAQGPNQFEVLSTDAAGNQAVPARLVNITLDTTPPVLSQLAPVDGAVLYNLSFPVSGQANEALAQVRLNGAPVALLPNGRVFAGTSSVAAEGEYDLSWSATDLAGNVAQASVRVQVVLKLLQEQLISVVPDPDSGKLVILGATGATRPGAKLTASAGFFNSGEATALEDGSFQLPLKYFEQATLTARDLELNRSESISLSYAVDTRLTGVVKDTEGRPLPGVRISVVGSQMAPVTSNSSGVFVIDPTPTGDQSLSIDGSAVQDPCLNCPARKFLTTTVKVTVGLDQGNVLERPIYLAPHFVDGSQVAVAQDAETIVTSPHAPGVELSIPPGALDSPAGSPVEISMSVVPSEFTTVQPPEYVSPASVVNLEPSGLRFSEPVAVTLPNENELEPGTQVVLMSFDSASGTWGPDGIAQVSDDGRSLTTTEDGGITHFSQIFAMPAAPKVRQLGAQDQPGTNMTDGAVATQVTLPSYKTLGRDFAPQLLYRSSWARPEVMVTNIFDFRKSTFKRELGQGQALWNKITVNQKGWVEPWKVTGQFFSTGLQTPSFDFTGPFDLSGTLSYSVDLSTLPSGVHPYQARYEYALKFISVVTKETRRRRYGFFGPKVLKKEDQINETFLNEVVPSNLTGPLYVQNLSNSSAGRGWRIAGPSRIVNPNAQRLMIEESDGSTSGYVLQNTVETLFNPSGSTANLSKGVDLTTWPFVAVVADNAGVPSVARVDLRNGQFNGHLFNTPDLVGTVRSNYEAGIFRNDKHIQRSVRSPHSVEAIIDLGPSGVIAIARGTSSVLQDNGVTVTRRAGQVATPPTFSASVASSARNQLNDYCNGRPDVVCGAISGERDDHANSTGQVRVHGFADGGQSSSRLNRPMGTARHPLQNGIAIADNGNHVVRYLDLNTGVLSTIAGNRQTVAKTDGVAATASSLVSPRGVAYDQAGNLFISTGEGYIRFVDTTGKIDTIAGLPFDHPEAILADEAPADRVSLDSPYGLAVDSQNGFLYVADYGHDRVLQVDLVESYARVIVGGGESVSDQAMPALALRLSRPTHLGLDPDNNLLVTDSGNLRIRRVNLSGDGSGILAYAPVRRDFTSLERNGDGTWVRRFRNGSQIFYRADGLEEESRDRVGRVTEYEYNASGSLTAMIDPMGRRTNYEYSGSRLSAIQDPTGRRTTLQHSDGQLIRVSFPDGTAKAFDYDENALLARELDAGNRPTEYVYNEWKRLAEVIRADGSRVAMADAQSQSAVRSGTNQAIRGEEALSTQITHAGKTTTLTYNQKGWASAVDYADGSQMVMVVDDLGRTQEMVRYNPEGVKVAHAALEYDPTTDDVLEQQDLLTGLKTQQTYNEFGQILTTRDVRGVTTTNEYEPSTGLPKSVSNSVLGLQEALTYGSHGLPSRRTTATGAHIHYTYDSFGNLQSLRQAVPGLGDAVVSHVRDAAGNITESRNPKNQLTVNEYDLWNRLRSVTTPGGEKTEYEYSATGKLAAIYDPVNGRDHPTLFVYDELDRMLTKTDPLGFALTRNYDEVGNVSYERDAEGQTKHFEYDLNNRMLKKTLVKNDGTVEQVVSFAYNSEGMLLQANNASSALNYTYDPVSKNILSSSTAGPIAVSLQYSYDEFGNRTEVRDPSGSTRYEFDNLGRLERITNPSGDEFAFSYDSSNRLNSISRPGSTSTYTFDSTNFLVSIVHARPNGAQLSHYNYGRDFNGSRSSVDSSEGLKTYSYDANQQLISSTGPGSVAESFSYDSLFNRESDQVGQYRYDARKQRLTEDYRYFYFHDKNGNLITRQAKANFPNGEITNYRYSVENQLVSLRTTLGGSLLKEVFYSYDALGRRIEKRVVDAADLSNGLTRRFVYNGDEILLEYDGNQRLLARYTHSGLQPDDILAAEISLYGQAGKLATSAGSYHYLKDAQGTVTELSDPQGNLIQRYVYSAFGALLGVKEGNAAEFAPEPPVRTSYAYTGREYDSESGLYYYRARYYDAHSGRFLQLDAHPGRLDAPATVVNRSSYALNSPTRFTDPSGNFVFVGLFIAALATSSTITSSAIVAGAIIGATASLAAVEALKYNFNTGQMIKSEGWDLFGIAAIGGISGGFGGWLGRVFGKAAFGSAAGNSLAQRMAVDAVTGSVASSLNTAGMIGAGYVEGGKDDILSSFLWGFGLGGVSGYARSTFYPALSVPTVIVSEGTVFFYLNQPIPETR